jgi:hypothetical protein
VTGQNLTVIDVNRRKIGINWRKTGVNRHEMDLQQGFEHGGNDMTTRYSERLGDWIRQEELKQRDQSLVAFLAVREDVSEALEAGYAAKTIWRNMQATKQFAFGYDTFLKYVNRFLCRPQRNRTSMRSRPDPPGAPVISRQESKASDKDPVAKTSKPAASAGFTFNPVPKKNEELF